MNVWRMFLFLFLSFVFVFYFSSFILFFAFFLSLLFLILGTACAWFHFIYLLYSSDPVISWDVCVFLVWRLGLKGGCCGAETHARCRISGWAARRCVYFGILDPMDRVASTRLSKWKFPLRRTPDGDNFVGFHSTELSVDTKLRLCKAGNAKSV